eukprot:COSAG04_NODE_17732_length_460_cov_1.163435_1_plen_32_part_10
MRAAFSPPPSASPGFSKEARGSRQRLARRNVT